MKKENFLNLLQITAFSDKEWCENYMYFFATGHAHRYYLAPFQGWEPEVPE